MMVSIQSEKCKYTDDCKTMSTFQTLSAHILISDDNSDEYDIDVETDGRWNGAGKLAESTLTNICNNRCVPSDVALCYSGYPSLIHRSVCLGPVPRGHGVGYRPQLE